MRACRALAQHGQRALSLGAHTGAACAYWSRLLAALYQQAGERLSVGARVQPARVHAAAGAALQLRPGRQRCCQRRRSNKRGAAAPRMGSCLSTFEGSHDERYKVCA